ncbi:MAG: CotH kinase family protein [Lachnospiraceae bacterium]|nr:CotH kinase family protein [Lachnospiraceae bacterium]
MKRKAWYIGTSVLILGLFVLFHLFELQSIKKSYLEFSVDNTNIDVSFFENSKGCYVFLPGEIEKSSVRLRCSALVNYVIDGKKYKNNDIIEGIENNKSCAIEIKNMLGITIKKENVNFLGSNKIATVNIVLDNCPLKKINSDKRVETSGKISVLDSNGNNNYVGKIKKIHGRGNSSWNEAKKPYSVQLEEKASLLDIDKGKNWVLNASACDESLIRNKLVYDVAKEVGMEFSPNSKYVNLFINKEYLGVYLLVEKIEVDENRVNICDLEKETQKVNSVDLKDCKVKGVTNDTRYIQGYEGATNPANNSGGYILETTRDDRLWNLNCYFITRNGTDVIVDAPKNATLEQTQYISDIFQNIEDNLENKNIGTMIDLESWSIYYLLQEGVANTEAVSFFYYKKEDDDLIYAGPVWDYDLSLGAAFGTDGVNANVFFVNKWGWYEKLYLNDVFFNKMKDNYIKKFRAKYKEVIEQKIEEYEKELDDAFEINQLRWNDVSKFQWTKHFDNKYQYWNDIKSFMTKRLEFMDDVWIDNKIVYRVYAYSGEPYYHCYYWAVNDGKLDGKLPTLQADGYEFLGWYDSKTEKQFCEDDVIDHDISLVAKWGKKDK